jgi:hypothetical protein
MRFPQLPVDSRTPTGPRQKTPAPEKAGTGDEGSRPGAMMVRTNVRLSLAARQRVSTAICDRAGRHPPGAEVGAVRLRLE